MPEHILTLFNLFMDLKHIDQEDRTNIEDIKKELPLVLSSRTLQNIFSTDPN